MFNLIEKTFTHQTSATLQWLEKSIIATNYKGSAAYFHLWKGWSEAYPETTGYIIETLFDYAHHLKEEKWKNLAISCGNWLCSIQNEDGAFPGGVGTQGQPIIFDTGQILFGLTRAFQETNEAKYLAATKGAVLWLLKNLEPDGSWRKFAYVSDYTPSYYTRVIWGILYANQFLKLPEVMPQMQQALAFYAAKVTPQHTVSDWSFAPQESAFTHTIAYTLRGFLESSVLIKNEDLLQIVIQKSNKIIGNYNKNGKLAGRYHENWQGDYTFTCVTGNAQISIVLARLYQLTRENIYRDYAIKIFQDVADCQWTLPFPGLRGGIPGSFPVWGAYQPFRFPNWAAKFYLDVYLLLLTNY